ncbi:MAG: hypothetical protein ACFCUG_07715 [Thiotrichales bacterium]
MQQADHAPESTTAGQLQQLLRDQLATLPTLWRSLLKGRLKLDRWPLIK